MPLLDSLDFDNETFQDTMILQLFWKLYPHLALEFRHISDCSACHATLISPGFGSPVVTTGAEAAITTVAQTRSSSYQTASDNFTQMVDNAKNLAEQAVKG